MTKSHLWALRAIAILWALWGLVHLLAGFMILMSDASGGFQAIADHVNAADLHAQYHPAVAGVLHQHGWNLGWFGATTLIGAGLIWRRSLSALWVTAMIGGLADLGYLLFLDLPGYVNAVPGTLMTVISGTAIALSLWVWRPMRRG